MPSRDAEPVYVMTREAARHLGVSAPTVARWVERGLLRAHRTPGGHRRIRMEDVAVLAVSLPPGSARGEGAGSLVLLDADPGRAALFAAQASAVHGVRVAWVGTVFEAGLWLARLDAVALLVDAAMPGVDPVALGHTLLTVPGARHVPVVVVGDQAGAVSLSSPVGRVLATIAARVRGHRVRAGPVRSPHVGATSRSG